MELNGCAPALAESTAAAPAEAAPAADELPALTRLWLLAEPARVPLAARADDGDAAEAADGFPALPRAAAPAEADEVAEDDDVNAGGALPTRLLPLAGELTEAADAPTATAARKAAVEPGAGAAMFAASACIPVTDACAVEAATLSRRNEAAVTRSTPAGRGVSGVQGTGLGGPELTAGIVEGPAEAGPAKPGPAEPTAEDGTGP